MSSSEKPKRRLVVYIAEETYEKLQYLAKLENRSISSVAESKLFIGLSEESNQTGTDRHDTDRAGQARHTIDPFEIKTSVISVLTDLPEENLKNFALKLQRIISQYEMVQTGSPTILKNKPEIIPGKNHVKPVETSPEQINSTELNELFKKRGISANVIKKVLESGGKSLTPTQELAIRLNNYMEVNDFTQRSFKKIHGFDVSQLTRWMRGTRGMAESTRKLIETLLTISLPIN